MNAEQALFDAYSEWRRLALAGRQAISRRDWVFFSQCHREVTQIQILITNLSRKLPGEREQSGEYFVARQKNIHAMVSELIELTHQNRKLIGSAREAVQAKRGELEQAGRNLKRLQSSYVSARPAAWTSYS
jgi:hypothetical protein